MAHTFRTQGAGSQQTLHEIEDEKVPIYDTKADAEADLANLAEGQIIGTKDVSTDYESELYNYVDAKLQTTEVDVPISGVSLSCKARRSGNTVTVELIATGSDVVIPHTANTTIGTLPAGYRPIRMEEFDISGRVLSSSADVGTFPPRVRFNTDGTIEIRDWNADYDVTINSAFNTYTFLVDGSNNNFMSVNTLKDAKDYTDARAVRKYDYSMTGTDNVYNDIKALCNQLVSMGVNTYAGSFLRTGRTHGFYSITVSQASSVITLNGTVVVDHEQGKSNIYAVSRVNSNWFIMPNVLNSNVQAADCNIVVNPGIYSIAGAANGPYVGCYGILEVKGLNPDVPSDGAQWIFQKVINTDGRRFVRRCINPNTLSPTSAQWSAWQEEDVFSHDMIVAQPASPVVGYLNQVQYFLRNADWTKIDASEGYRREFVGSMELSGYWYGTYHLSQMGLGYKVINGAIYGEGQPVRFSGWYDPNYVGGWRVTLSYNYTYIDISQAPQIADLNQQLSTALNLVAPQSWNVQHCDCNIEVLGFFYAMGTFDQRGSWASFSGTILSSDQNVNGQSFTAEYEVTRNYWVVHNITMIKPGIVAVDGNSNFYLSGVMGTDNAEIIYVKSTNSTQDFPMFPAKNTANQWYCRVTDWAGNNITSGTQLSVEVKYRLL